MRQRAGTDVLAQEKEGGGPGKIELDLKKKKLQIHPAELQSRGWRH